MNKTAESRTKQQIAVMQAFADGLRVQVRANEGEANWETTHLPTWNWQEFDYRVKPAYRPWTLEEIPVGAIIRPKEDPSIRAPRQQIVGVMNSGNILLALDGGLSTDSLLKHYTLVDGVPCGVLE